MKSLLTTLLLTTLAFGSGHKKSTPLSSCANSGNSVVCGDHLATQDEIRRLAAGDGQGTISNSGATLPRDSRGRIARSPEARSAFKQLHPCPSTGLSYGSCPGYVIDHVNPLACGGPDAPSNMQWQTIADGKSKDKIERKTCGGQ